MKSTNQKSARVSQLILALALAAVTLPGFATQTQKPSTGEQIPPPLIRSLKGPDLFQAYCASCHGLDARGTGPAAPAMKTRVPDLTLLTKNYYGKFPADHVRKVILGDAVMPAHGSREMPIWGPVFHHVERDMDWGEVRVTNLIEYLHSIQLVDSSKVPSGAKLYEQDCAICHGEDLKGTGPVPDPFRTPPDLTLLAKSHGGVFPEAYVSNVLRRGVLIPGHGPAEMPIWGTDFAKHQWSERQLAARIANLTDFIKSRQMK